MYTHNHIHRAEAAEAQRDVFASQIDAANQAVAEEKERCALLTNQLTSALFEIDKRDALLEARKVTEAILTDEARALIGTLKKSTAEGERCVCV
jgi:hypothetical protein